MSTEIYSLASNFLNGLDASQLINEVNADGGIAQNCNRVKARGDTVTIFFDNTLDAGEQIVLNNVVAAHIPFIQGEKIMNMGINFPDITETDYSTVLTFAFPGTNFIVQATHINIIGHMLAGGTSYDARIVDITNNNIIVIVNCTNVDEEICNMGALSNLPTSQSIFELQIKVNGVTTVIARNLNLYYD